MATTVKVSPLVRLCLVGIFGLPVLFAAHGLRAQSVPTTILFIGNSFTHGRLLPVRTYNSAAVTDENQGLPASDARAFHPRDEEGPYGGIPGIFKKLTDEAGLHYEVHSELVSAKNLQFHYEHARSLVAQAKWNAMVLQGFSTEALPVARGGKPENFSKYAAMLEDALHAVNPAARIYLYETWPRADLTYPEKGPYHGEPIEAMGNDLHDGYQRAFTEDGHFTAVARVGDAWLDAMHTGVAQPDPYKPGEESGPLDLWGPDHDHPSIYGAYLSALVLFHEITGVDPRTFGPNEQVARDLGIPGDRAVKLQTVAGAGHNEPPPRASPH